MLLLVGVILWIVRAVQWDRPPPMIPELMGGIACIFAWFICWLGYFVVGPGDSRAILFFGKYQGTVRSVGFFWVKPFSNTRRVSLRVRTFETGSSVGNDVTNPATGQVLVKGARTRGHPIKVNDRDGNPIEIAAVVVWQVVDTAQALFDVDDYVSFVDIQAESALRNLASQFHYDAPDDHVTPSLRGNTDLIGAKLRDELHQRLAQAGVEVLEARISSLAYAPEIAAVMLRRQQATAVVAARTKIVEGAVGMVEMALSQLEARKIASFSDVDRVRMVSNLLVVLCGETNAQPVVQTGHS
ncbi:MAG: SPFH domain-containing protein [Phycisphaerales bacterium]|nr:SPFH domain-containing protein [Phycisphaerales bacterium]